MSAREASPFEFSHEQVAQPQIERCAGCRQQVLSVSTQQQVTFALGGALGLGERTITVIMSVGKGAISPQHAMYIL